MIEINPTRFKFPPYRHQLRGLRTLLQKPEYGLFWEMRLGKTKPVIDAACLLHEAGELDVLFVECPAQVKPVWTDSELGEIKTHCFLKQYLVFDYDARREHLLDLLKQAEGHLIFIVASMEFLRQEARVGRTRTYPKAAALWKAICKKKIWHVVDEGSAVGNHKSNQWRMTRKFREHIPRFTLLDGTPIADHETEQYAKFQLVKFGQIGYQTYSQFVDAHGVKGGFKGKQIVSFKDQHLIDERMKDYCEFLEQKDCLDMPEKVRETVYVTLTEERFKQYRQLKKELYLKLESGEVTVNHAPVLILRLAQFCAGFLGGVVDENNEKRPTEEVGTETHRWFIDWLYRRLQENPKFKCVVWSRWRAEIERLISWLERFKSVEYGYCYGGGDRNLMTLHPKDNYDGAFVMVAQPQAAKFGNNWSKADTVIYLSQDYSRLNRKQSEDRVQAPGVRKTTLMLDVVVTGPGGEPTVTRDIVASLRRKEDIAARTVENWKKLLQEDV